MAQKRDFVAEILDRKSRALRGVDRLAYYQLRTIQIGSVVGIATKIPRDSTLRSELLKYVAIAHVGALEAYFRALFADLVDSGEPFRSRAGQFDEVRPGINAVFAMHQRAVTPGEFVAHFLAISGVSDINRHMSILLDQDFVSTIMGRPTSRWQQKILRDAFPQIPAEIDSLFRLRHILAHEFAPKERPKVRKIRNCMASCVFFVINTEELVQERLLPAA